MRGFTGTNVGTNVWFGGRRKERNRIECNDDVLTLGRGTARLGVLMDGAAGATSR